MRSPKKKKKLAPQRQKKKTKTTRKIKTSVVKAEEEFGEVELIESVWSEMMDQAKKNPALSLLYERMQGNLKLIGLTGGIASGKSTLATHLRSLGIPVIDADEIARDVVQPGSPVLDSIVQTFGPEARNSDGTLNRAKVAEMVFADDTKRKWLESVTHPEILRHIAEKIREIRDDKNPKTIVIEAALLFESGLYQSMDKNILITAPEDTRFQRLLQRGGIAETEALQRIRSQMPDAEKEKLADFILENSGEIENARTGLVQILSQCG